MLVRINVCESGNHLGFISSLRDLVKITGIVSTNILSLTGQI
jgi:hypothetical protein